MGCGGSTDNVCTSNFPSAQPYRNTTAPSESSSPTSHLVLHYYTLSTVLRHNTAKSFWCVIRGKVYDLTTFLHQHPGGMDILLAEATGDATTVYEQEHGGMSRPYAILQALQIGLVVPEKDPRAGSVVANPETSVTVSASPRPTDHSPAAAVAGQGLVGDDVVYHRAKSASAANISVLQSYTADDVAAHHTMDDCWTIRKGQVYDLTRYFPLQKEGIIKLPALEHKKLAGQDATSYFDSSSQFQSEAFLQSLEKYQIGFLVGHAPTENRSRRGSRRGSFSASAGRPAINVNYNARSDEAVEALNAIAADDLTHAAAEGLIASPSATRYLWKLISRDSCTHDTQLLTFHPLTTDASIAEFMAGFDADEIALHAAYPVKYSTAPAAIRSGQHFSIEIPKHLPRENAENHTARERENRPLDVPFRMQRAYSPINSYQTEVENPRAAVTFLIRHYPGFDPDASAAAEGADGAAARKGASQAGNEMIPPGAGSTFMSHLPLGGVITTTAARGLFHVDCAFDGYDTFVFLGGGTGVAPLFPILKDMVRRASGRSASPSASTHPQFTKSFTFLSCHRSEEDVLLEEKLQEMQAEQAPGRAGVSVYTVLSQPMFSPKASTFSGQLNLDMLRVVIPPAFQPTIMHVLPSDGILDSSRVASRAASPVSRVGSAPSSSRSRSPAKFTFGIADRAASPAQPAMSGGQDSARGAGSDVMIAPLPQQQQQQKDDGSLLRKTLGVLNAGKSSSRRPSCAGGEGRVPGLILPESSGGPHRKALCVLCGPPGFNQNVLQLLYRFGFKRGRGNPTGKDVFVL